MSLTSIMDDRNALLSQASYESNINTHNDNFLKIFGDEYKWINGTYSSFIRRPDLFGETSLTLLYAMYVGKRYRKESLYNMFKNFMNKAPESKDVNILFLWADELLKHKKFIDFEPTFNILNDVLSSWMTRKTVLYEGKEIGLDVFRPLLYNTAGINLVKLLPYLAYLYTYLIYGYPFTFSDAYSSSSLQSFYNILENWFASCYTELYKEQGFSIVSTDTRNAEIPDDLWQNFYKKMLDSKCIIEIRNEEINKTDNQLLYMTETQKSIVKDDLLKKYNIVLTKLVEIAASECSYKNIYKSIQDFDETFFNPTEFANITSFFVSNTDYDIIIDEHNDFKYLLYNGIYSQLPSQFSLYKPKTNIKKLNYSLNKPFTGADVILNIFTGLLRERFISKRTNQFDETPMYLYPGNLQNDDLYAFIMTFFTRGVWAFENREMSQILFYFMNNDIIHEYLNDMLNAFNALKILHGYTTKTILTPIYALSCLNIFIYEHCRNGRSLSEFNPFIYLKNHTIDTNRILKLQNILYSMLFIFNDNYVKLVNDLNVELYNILQSNPLITIPYIQTINDNSRFFILGGCDCFTYSKSPNPFVRSYGFMSDIMGSDESINILYRYTEHITNINALDIINDNKYNTTTVIDDIITVTNKMSELLPELLFRYKFETNSTNTNVVYNERSNRDFAYLIDPDTNKYVVELMMSYAFEQTLNSNVLNSEQIRIKTFKLNDNMMLSASTPSTINKFVYNEHEYVISLSPIGNSVYLPYLGTVSDVVVRNVNFVNPDGMYHYKILIPSTGVHENNNVVWMWTKIRPVSKFDGFVDLKSSNMKPTDGSFMITDRIQQFPKY